jgi:hypothetical protein
MIYYSSSANIYLRLIPVIYLTILYLPVLDSDTVINIIPYLLGFAGIQNLESNPHTSLGYSLLEFIS